MNVVSPQAHWLVNGRKLAYMSACVHATARDVGRWVGKKREPACSPLVNPAPPDLATAATHSHCFAEKTFRKIELKSEPNE